MRRERTGLVDTAGPYANNLHFAADRSQHLIAQFLQTGCSSCTQPTVSEHWRTVNGALICIPIKDDTHTHPFNGPFSGTTRVSQYQKGNTNLDFTETRDSEWQWHQLGHMQVCTSLQTDNHAGTPPLSFLQAGCPSCHPTNSVKALKASIKADTVTENWAKN